MHILGVGLLAAASTPDSAERHISNILKIDCFFCFGNMTDEKTIPFRSETYPVFSHGICDLLKDPVQYSRSDKDAVGVSRNHQATTFYSLGGF